MTTNRSNNSDRTKSFTLAACAVIGMGFLSAGEASAQCRYRGGNAGYGVGYGHYTNTRSYNRGYNNSRWNSDPDYGYGASNRRGYSNRDFVTPLNVGFSNYRNSSYHRGYGNVNYRNVGYNNSRVPAAYRHGNHIDVDDGYNRYHLRGRNRLVW